MRRRFLGLGRRCLAVALLGGVLAACGRLTDAAPGPNDSGVRVQKVKLLSAPPAPPMRFMTNHGLVASAGGSDVPANAEAGTGLTGWLSPMAVPFSNGLVAYNAWQTNVPFDPEKSWSSQGIVDGQAIATPSIRIMDTVTGSDALLEEGAYSVAWRLDGAIAYVKGVERDYRVNHPYLGSIVVRSSVSSTPTTWLSQPDEYIVHSWAGDSLLAYSPAGLIAIDGPHRARVLATNAGVIAVSPEGTHVLVTHGPGNPLELIEVRTGRVIATLDLSYATDSATGAVIVTLNDAGSWMGDWAAAEATLESGDAAIVILNMTNRSVALHSVLVLPRTPFAMGVHEPQLADIGGLRVVAWSPIDLPGGEAKGRQYVYVDCDVATATCSQGPPRAERLFHPVYNPSRPFSGGVPNA